MVETGERDRMLAGEGMEVKFWLDNDGRYSSQQCLTADQEGFTPSQSGRQR